MKTFTICATLIFFSGVQLFAGALLNREHLGQQLGGWEAKNGRAADYELSGSRYRTWKPEVTPMLDGGIFISVRIDHLRGLFASDDHASLQVTLNKDGDILSAQSSMAFQGRKITSDAIRLTTSAGTSVIGVEQVVKVGTDLLANLTSKLMRENVAEPGRVTFPAAIHHNYNLLCLSIGKLEDSLINKKEDSLSAQNQEPLKESQQTELKIQSDPSTHQKIGQLKTLETGP